MELSGIFAPIPTPFRGGELDLTAHRRNLALWGATRLAGLVVLGSNGEYVFLDRAEKERLIVETCASAPAGKLIIGGTGCESTRETISLTRFAAGAGAAAALVITPHYYKASMTESALERFYRDVAEASPIPIILYNMPGNTGLNMAAGLVGRLSQHPNIVGIKDSGGNIVQIAEIIAAVSAGFAVFAGSGSFLYPSLCLGAVGGTLAVANIMADECHAIFAAHAGGDAVLARRLQLNILEVNKAVTSRWGVAGLKAAMDILGYTGGEPRLPVLPLQAAERAELAAILARASCRSVA